MATRAALPQLVVLACEAVPLTLLVEKPTAGLRRSFAAHVVQVPGKVRHNYCDQ